VATLRASVEKNIRSDDAATKQRALEALPAVEHQERAARAILTLLPDLYKTPGQAVLRMNWEKDRAELYERPKKNEAATNLLRFVDFSK